MSRNRAEVLRLFVAAYPPAAAAEQMLGAAARLDLRPHRATPAPQVHLTLAFLGRTPERQLDAVTESIQRAVSGLRAFTLTPAHLNTLPLGNRPRLLALTTDAPSTLLELVRRLVLRLVANPREHPTDAFLPHFTLCRFQPDTDAQSVHAPALIEPFQIDRVHLMRSVQLPEGAEHRELGVFPLQP